MPKPWQAELDALEAHARAGVVLALELRAKIQQPGQFAPSSNAAAVCTVALTGFNKTLLAITGVRGMEPRD